MKIFFILSIFTFAEVSTQTNNINNITKACSKEHNLRFQTYSDYFKALRADDDQILLFSECLFSELGYLNRSGEILYKEVKKRPWYFSYLENFSNLVDKCTNNVAKTSYMFVNCLLSNIIQILQHNKQQWKKEQNAADVCREENNMTIESVRYMKYANTQQSEVWFMCYLRELGCVSRNGSILYHKVTKHNYFFLCGPDKYSTLVDECKNESSAIKTFVKCILFNVNETQYHANEQAMNDWNAKKVCSEKTNLTIQYYPQLDEALLAGGDQVKLFVECYLHKIHCLDNNGDILYEKLKQQQHSMIIPDEYFSRSVDECQTEKGNNTINTYYKFFFCFRSNIVQTYYQRTVIHQYIRTVNKHFFEE
ncbi:hypothetical protein FQA39_LY00498 [Lamprigera yunnana]|nr:hypothetical protein FQA39_LY00498 [Lamprigera yunnana]